MKYKIGGIFVLSSIVLVALMQNCGQNATFTQMSTQDIVRLNSDSDGDYGTGGGGYDCVKGQKLKVYLDPYKDGVVKKENYLGTVVAYSGSETAAENYNYFSASAHPIQGPTPLGFEGNIFFYKGSDGLALNLFANVDAGGSDDNIVNVDIEVSKNTSNDSVLLSDDKDEIKEVSKSKYQGRFHYWSNTDGGVIGPFNLKDPFEIRVEFLTSGDVKSARFYSANDFHFSLNKKAGEIHSFIIVNGFYEACTAK